MKLTTINKASNSLDNIRNVFINSKIESPITITPCRFIDQYYLIYIYQNYLIYLENNKDTCQKILQQVPSDKTTCICASFIRYYFKVPCFQPISLLVSTIFFRGYESLDCCNFIFSFNSQTHKF